MRTLATKQPTAQNSVRQKPTNKALPKVRSPSTSLTGSTILQRKPACPCGGGCPRCQKEALLQTKLKTGEPGDKYEQEARIAKEVLRMPEPTLQRQIEPEKAEKLQGQPIEEEKRDNSCKLSIDPIESLVLKQFANTNLIWTGQIRTSIFGTGILTVRSTVSEVLEEPQIKVKEIVSESKNMTVDCTSKCTIDRFPEHDNFASSDVLRHRGVKGDIHVQIRTTNKSPSRISTELTAGAELTSSAPRLTEKFKSQKVTESKCQ